MIDSRAISRPLLSVQLSSRHVQTILTLPSWTRFPISSRLFRKSKKPTKKTHLHTHTILLRRSHNLRLYRSTEPHHGKEQHFTLRIIIHVPYRVCSVAELHKRFKHHATRISSSASAIIPSQHREVSAVLVTQEKFCSKAAGSDWF